MHKADAASPKLLLRITILATVVIVILGNFNNPPNGHTGAPGDSLCTACHSLGGGSQNGNVVVNGFPANIVANQTYSLSVTVANPNGLATFAGFQMVILDAGNNNAGTMSNAGPNSTITISGGRSYHEHNPAQMFDASNMETWTVDWTAPVGSGLLTYYAAGNVANGNGNDNGDLIVTTNGSGNLTTPLLVEITEVEHVTCFGFMDGSVTAEASFGMPGYTYAWSNGGNGPMISGLGPGTYTVTVTDNVGATATASAQVTEPPEFVIVSAVVNDVSCNGGSDGQIMVTLAGGVPPYTGAQGNIFTLNNLQAGDYTVTVSDDNGCVVSEDYTVDEPAAIFIDAVVIIDPECFGDATGLITVEPSGGVGDFTFAWSNGQTNATIQNLQAGSYTVTVTDDNGCTESDTYVLEEPELLFLDLLELEHVSCAGQADGSITVAGSGGTGSYTYAWSNGAQGSSISDLGPGAYTVTLTDNNGCMDDATYIVNEPAAITVAVSGTMALVCFGDSTGMLTATGAGGTAPLTYNWSNGQSGATIIGLGAGSYTVTVSDVNGCTATASATITQPAQLLPNATSTNETAPGAMDGTATSDPTGGTGAYSFLWSTGDTTAMITGLAVGVYTVTVTDANGCMASQSVNVSGTNCTLAVTVSTSPALCFGESNGSATVMISGAMGATSITWSNGDTTMQITGLAAGTYGVTVTDAEGCLATSTAVVTQPAVLSSTCVVVHESGDGTNDGSVTCSAAGGTMPYQYVWSTGDTTATIDSLSPGTYLVTITDANDCERIDTAVVNPFSCALTLSTTSVSPTCFGDTDGAAAVSVMGGTPPYVYDWSNGSDSASIADVPAGTYGLTVTDADNCVSEIDVVIGQPDALSVVVDTVIHATGGEQNGSISITASGGTPPYAYVWTLNGGPFSTSEDLTGLGPGDYVLEVVDANGCTLSAGMVTVTVTTGLEEIPDGVLKVWPVPARQILNLDVGALIPTGVSLYSSAGQLLRTYDQSAARSGVLDIHALDPGVYYLYVRGETWYKVLPIIK